VLGRSSAVSSWSSKVRVFPRGLHLEPPNVDKAVLAVVYDALLENRRFDVTYRIRGEKTDRTFEVNPIALVVRGSLLTLVSTIGKSQSPRQLHLHRMREAKASARSALVPAGFDLDTHIREGNLAFLLGANLRIRACVAAVVVPTLEETPLSKDQKLTRMLDGRVILEVTLPDTLELRGWLASYGPHIEVLEPAQLRAQIGRQAREAAAMYPPMDPRPSSLPPGSARGSRAPNASRPSSSSTPR
jgi:predicted DNA-binding transcriptional regulator YafY